MARQEALWIPGARFEAKVAADRVTAEILDRKEGTRFKALDAEAMRKLLVAANAVARGMDGEGPLHAEAVRFVGDVASGRTVADLMDLEAAGAKNAFILLSRTDVEELREMTDTVREIMETARR